MVKLHYFSAKVAEKINLRHAERIANNFGFIFDKILVFLTKKPFLNNLESWLITLQYTQFLPIPSVAPWQSMTGTEAQFRDR